MGPHAKSQKKGKREDTLQRMCGLTHNYGGFEEGKMMIKAFFFSALLAWLGE